MAIIARKLTRRSKSRAMIVNERKKIVESRKILVHLHMDGKRDEMSNDVIMFVACFEMES